MVVLFGWWVATVVAEDLPAPSYEDEIAPLLTKYCTGCHNSQDAEGGLSLETYAELQSGIETAPVVLPGQPASSRLIRVLTGLADPPMPPEDNPVPSEAEVALIHRWIEAGARGPAGTLPDVRRLRTPKIEGAAKDFHRPITALTLSSNGQRLAIARFRQVEVVESVLHEPVRTFHDLPGKVHAVEFSPDGKKVLIATGVAGLYGEALVFSTDTGEQLHSLSAQRDILYDAQYSPDGHTIATASYDQTILLWDLASKKPTHSLAGHHGAVFDLAFSPDGKVLASASADETVKLWHVATGERLDTLGQPTAEQYCVTFSPDGSHIAAAGADRRIRVWEFVSRNSPQINPIIISRFAHEQTIIQLDYTPDGKALLSTSEDGSIKVWDTEAYAESVILDHQSQVINDWAVSPSGERLVVGRNDGTWDIHEVLQPQVIAVNASVADSPRFVKHWDDNEVAGEIEEQEPNDSVEQAQLVSVPTIIKGTIGEAELPQATDLDRFRFVARKGEMVVLEVDAARSKSPLDSTIEVLTGDGRRIERVLLQAVRDSYMTFRGVDSHGIDGFRLHNWREMELNELLFVDGEVTKLFHYPRGPDSGFQLYPGFGSRHCWFDTSPVAHPLHAPAYIVEAHEPGARLNPSGLPVFSIYFENDDDALRQIGKDSRLTFVAPADGEYVVQIQDSRGFGGDKFHYALHLRRPNPDFNVVIGMEDKTIRAGSGREFSVTVTRKDGFDGLVRIDIQGLPDGFYASTPVVVAAGQSRASGTINTLSTTPPVAEGQASSHVVTATAHVAGKEITKNLAPLGELKLGDPLPAEIQVFSTMADLAALSKQENGIEAGPPEQPVPTELVIAPGETISAIVHVKRSGDTKNEVRLSGGAHAGRNLPHGVYVDNTGLSGLLIAEGSDTREFFITASKTVKETTRLFHLLAEVDGKHTSWPVILHVRRHDTEVAKP